MNSALLWSMTQLIQISSARLNIDLTTLLTSQAVPYYEAAQVRSRARPRPALLGSHHTLRYALPLCWGELRFRSALDRRGPAWEPALEVRVHALEELPHRLPPWVFKSQLVALPVDKDALRHVLKLRVVFAQHAQRLSEAPELTLLHWRHPLSRSPRPGCTQSHGFGGML